MRRTSRGAERRWRVLRISHSVDSLEVSGGTALERSIGRIGRGQYGDSDEVQTGFGLQPAAVASDRPPRGVELDPDNILARLLSTA
jgi:hypothetical protein